MAQVRFTTYHDLVRHVIDFLGANVSEEARRDARRAVRAAYDDLASSHRWHYYYQRGRITTSAQYTTGTIAYTHSSRTVTLTSGTWPSWAEFGTIIISSVPYEVSSRTSDSVIVLSVNSNPGANVDSGTSYTLYRDTYPLPADFLATDEMVNLNRVFHLHFEHPRYWLSRQRLVNSPAEPVSYTITSDPNYHGTMAVRFFPAPDQAYTIDFIYQRRPRALVVEEYKAGTATVSSGGNTVSGTSTTFLSSHVGSVIRLSANATDEPLGLEWSTPYRNERAITTFGSTTSLTVDSTYSEALSGVKYLISDPVDIEAGAMKTALLRGCEYQVSLSRNKKDQERAWQNYQQALIFAKEWDARSFATRSSSQGQAPWGYRLAHFPAGADD